MIFGVRPSSLFKSRWMALLWGVLVCLTAIGFVGSAKPDGEGQNAATDAAGDPITAQDIATLRNAVETE